MPPKRDNLIYYKPYGWIPRRMPDSDLINANPDLYIAEHKDELKNLIDKAAYLYYNTAESGLTDTAYDALVWHYKKLNKKKPVSVGAPVHKFQENLEVMMPSLSTLKPDSKKLTEFLKPSLLGNEKIIYSLKLDGTSGQATYIDGQLVKLCTRGDHIVGSNVTYLKDYINIPLTIDYKEKLVVRGEFMISKNNWQKYKLNYSNARAFTNGKINNRHLSDELKDIEFIAYEVQHYHLSLIPSSQLSLLKQLKFNVVKYGILDMPTVVNIIYLYKKERSEADYYIDGLVLTIDKEYETMQTLRLPTHIIAFKMQLEEQIRHTIVNNVDWSISRYARLFPVIEYEYVYINGARMHRATGHNARYIKEKNIGKGTEIDVIKSGDCIPQIKSVNINKDLDILYPNEKYHWVGCDLFLDDENDYRVKIQQMLHFFKTIGLKNFGEKTAENFYHNGLTKAEDVIKASVKDFLKIKGVGQKKANQYYDSIHSLLKTTPLDKFVAASPFKTAGRKTLKTLFKHIPNLFNLKENELLKCKVPGFGPVKLKKLCVWVPKVKVYLDSFVKEDLIAATIYNKERIEKLKINQKINNKNFVFSGFLMNTPDDIEDYIYDHGGDVVSKVDKKVEAVICGHISDITDKINTAYELKIPVYTVEEFKCKYNL